MLYMDRPSAPSEDELYNIFCRRWNPAGRVIVRTMDIGGDSLAYLNILRKTIRSSATARCAFMKSIRRCFTSATGDFTRLGTRLAEDYDPLISSMEEILWVKERLAEANSRCASRNPV